MTTHLPVLVAIISAVAGGAMSYVVAKRRESEKQEELWEDRLEDLENLMHGQGDSDIVKGVIDILTMHEDDIDDISERVETLEEKMREQKKKVDEMLSRIERLKNKHKERNGNDN